MNRFIAIKLALILLCTSLSSLAPVSIAYAQSKNMSTCENGECIEKLVDKLEDLGDAYQRQCLPSEGIKESDLQEYYEKNGLSENCWKLITEINELEKELQKHQARLEEKLGCQSGDCKQPNQTSSLNAQISALTKVEQNLSCTEPKKQAIRNQCPGDMGCLMLSTAMGMGGYIAEMFLPEKAKMKGCHLGDDSCATQLVTGFLKSVVSFFEGAWDLLKMGGKYAGKKMGEFWGWVTGAEDHSSTSQLALAKASEDPGVFDMLVKDFPGTMKKLFTALVAALKEWMKTDILCEKWSGAPHFSKCLKPTESFDCISCKAMANGLCAVSGVVIAEVVPAFLTGGLLTAAKEGARGASKIAKLFKVSPKAMSAMKNSRAAKMAVQAADKVDDVLKVSKGLQVAKVAVEAALKALRKYLLSPGRKILKSSYSAIANSLKKGTAYIAETKAGKVMIFSGKALKETGKIVIYPIDNPMTALAFKAGQRTFTRALKTGAAKVGTTTAVTSTLVRHEGALDSLLGKIEEAKIKPNKSQDVLKYEKELLTRIESKRPQLVKEALKNKDIKFNDLIRHLYPELQYGDLAKLLPADKVLAAEKQLWLAIEEMPDGALKTELTKRFNAHVVNGEARSKVLGNNSPTYKQVLDNSRLEDKARFDEAMKLLDKKPASAEESAKLSAALKEAHLAGPDNGVFEYSWSELREKYNILVKGGYSKDEADALIRAGIAGRPPVRELIQPGDTLFSGFAEDILDKNFLEQRNEFLTLIKNQDPQQKKGLLSRFFGGNKTPPPSQAINDNLDSLYFIDYSHSADELGEILHNGKKIENAALKERYEKQAFENFKETRAWLLAEKPEMNKETLLKIQGMMLKGDVSDFAKAEELGKIRSSSIIGNVPSSHAIDDTVKGEILVNPYLGWQEVGKTADGKFYGRILYPNVPTVEKKTLDLIRNSHPSVVKDVEEFQLIVKQYNEKQTALWKLNAGSPEHAKIAEEMKVLQARHTELSAESAKLNERLVDALVDDLMDWFTRQRSLIGDINSPEKLDEYVNVLADFQKRLVSIHPLMDGNGRSTREFALSYALMKEGFPPPRILDPNADIYTPDADWRKMIKHGILASDFLMDDLVERAKFGLPIENSVDLITPYTRPPVKMTYKGEKKVPYMDGVEYVDPRFYREVVKRLMKDDPALKAEMTSNPLAAWDKIHKRVEDIHTKNNIYYKHPKNGTERVALGYVDEDFKLLYGKASHDNKELYDFKMKTWYSKDVTWRGLASKHAEKSEDEIIQMFSELTSHNASNAVLGKIRGGATPETIKKAALEDFDKYNNDVFGDGLVAMARDHSETGPMYGISYGYSTSKNREVGKAFAMGAMVVGEYGAHKAPELQALLKSRVLVGARRANKDVDLGRLKQLREDFSYKYGRQQEVMGIGASDPDAITIVQTIDAEGKVMLSYLRNKDNPAEIFVVNGDIDPDAVPEASQIVKTISLSKK